MLESVHTKLALLAFALSVSHARAQPIEQPRLEFDIASIKPSNSNMGGQRFRNTPGALEVINMQPSVMIWNAYNLSLEGQLTGVPSWADNDIFDIEAKAEEDPSLGPAEAKARNVLRLQSLLMSRFQLRAHWETRTMQGSVLSVAKGGSKLKPSATGTDYRTRQGSGDLLCQRCSLPIFVHFLSNYLKVPVRDDSGIDGLFDINISFAPIETFDGDPKSERPALATVLQDRLGLKLESKKITIQVLVVDHIERPTSN
ncbi:MAG TPA: TIGR03435 family protein [Bryobacteraceae bacterium]|jgi:uncharacterized protein (TIGR03435 family)